MVIYGYNVSLMDIIVVGWRKVKANFH